MPGVHLTLEERKSIQSGLDSCKTKAEIAVGISKSASTVSKVILAHISPPKTLMHHKSHSRSFQPNSRKNKPDQLLEEHQKQKKTTQAG